nr:MAG TPA: putative hydrogenase [Caudoviricetes sp.]
MELQEYKVKNTTKCDCGHEFTIQDMQKLQRLSEPIYGGIIKHVDEIKCPTCGKETLLLIKQQGQTYIVKDIAQKSKENIEKTSMNNSDNNIDTTIQNEHTSNANNEIICPICQKMLKSKSGLTAHMRTHGNK